MSRCWNATIQHLLTDTKHYQNDIIRYLPESQDKRASGGLRSLAIGAQMAPPRRYRQASIAEAKWLPSEV
jgi:hypothetical protein